jgi:hypothetical protein
MKYLIEYKDWQSNSALTEMLKLDMAKLDFLRSLIGKVIHDHRIVDLIDSIIIFNQPDPYVNYREMIRLIKFKLETIGKANLISKIDELTQEVEKEEKAGNLAIDFFD